MMGDADSSVCPPKEKTDSDENLEDVYYFESDNLALKGNRDYGLLLRTVAVLEAQRQKAIEELDTLHSAHREALQDPIAFVDKLQRGVDLKLPKRQKIASLPQINWEQYTSNANLVNMGLHKHMTRLKKSATESTEVGFGSSTLSDNVGESGVTVVRGRVKDERKSSTFNQLWTVDEQRRLEELLTQYPPEEVEAKRWQKIATALGNRTLQQVLKLHKVASRVQKYFIKLAKAGLPIPGKVPNVGAHSKKAAHRHHRFQRFYQQPSTFMSSHEPPVYMSDDDDGYSYSGENSMDTDCGIASRPNTIVPFNDISDDETIPEYLRESDEYQELLQLKRIHAQKLQGPGYCKTRHFGFKCDKCECDPIVGVRWHCLDCPTESSIDFCEECVDSPFDIGRHNSSHRLEPIRDANAQTGHIDQDYTRFVQPGNYNYLDPNYMPAT